MSLCDDLAHVRWLGGGSGAGKSTVARRLAKAYDVAVYETDASMSDHAKRCSSTDCPQLAAFVKMSMDERWVDRAPEVMLKTFPWFNGEAFHLIVDDLLRMPSDRPIIVEGFRLLPRCVAPLLSASHTAVWLLPTAAFRRHALEARGSKMAIPRRTSDPKRALDNLLKRDEIFTERLGSETAQLGLRAICIDGAHSEADLTRKVGDIFFA
ncbi:MAG: hypothetical protein AAGK92_10990 [Pseudomonadota bacterium]